MAQSANEMHLQGSSKDQRPSATDLQPQRNQQNQQNSAETPPRNTRKCLRHFRPFRPPEFTRTHQNPPETTRNHRDSPGAAALSMDLRRLQLVDGPKEAAALTTGPKNP